MEKSGEKLYMGSSSQADQFSDEEVDTDKIAARKTKEPAMKKDDSFGYETADIATELTSSGDGVHLAGADIDPAEKERLEQEWKEELRKTEDEIATLRHVLSAKVQHAAELKRKLGITPLNEIRHDFSEGIKNIKESGAYVKTGAVLKTAGEKTTSAITNISAAVKGKLGDVRNSNTFKSFEERMGNAYTSVKRSRSMRMFSSSAPYQPQNQSEEMSKVTGSKSEDNFEDILTSTSKENDVTGTTNNGTTASPTATNNPTDGSR